MPDWRYRRGMANLIERHRNDIRGVLSCLDRVVIQGTIPSICHPKAMATMLDSRGIRLFDYTQFVQPFRDASALTQRRSQPKRASRSSTSGR